MIKIFDCSNSVERPNHRGGGGPIKNDIIRYLEEYSNDYNCQFIGSHTGADIILTNDVFPANVFGKGIPLVKRMCGPFWQRNLQYRNIELNRAARLADKVIFITKYSEQQYFHCFGDDLKDQCVVTHWVDPSVYYETLIGKNSKFTLAASATNWNRKEKRLDDLINFGILFPEINIMIIGTVDIDLPNNFIKTGYLSRPEDIAIALNKCDGFINLSYRDAATKTICQAINCNLPVLFADSGGVSEIVNGFGIAIKDSKSLDIEESVPDLNINNIASSFKEFRLNYFQLMNVVRRFDKLAAFKKMFDGYYSAIYSVLK